VQIDLRRFVELTIAGVAVCWACMLLGFPLEAVPFVALGVSLAYTVMVGPVVEGWDED
jgi:hypothetical protein